MDLNLINQRSFLLSSFFLSFGPYIFYLSLLLLFFISFFIPISFFPSICITFLKQFSPNFLKRNKIGSLLCALCMWWYCNECDAARRETSRSQRTIEGARMKKGVRDRKTEERILEARRWLKIRRASGGQGCNGTAWLWQKGGDGRWGRGGVTMRGGGGQYDWVGESYC